MQGTTERQAAPQKTGDVLLQLVAKALDQPVDPSRSLVAHGLDSMGAHDLFEALFAHGYQVAYPDLLGDLSVATLASSLRRVDEQGPAPRQHRDRPVPLTPTQQIWATLDARGWGNWANISLCVSLPATAVPAAHLPAFVQALCDANEAMRTVLLRGAEPETLLQVCLERAHVPVAMREAPRRQDEILRAIEAFEGEVRSPFEPTTRALVLSGQPTGRHWLCITMHHLFADRVSLHTLARQLTGLLDRSSFRVSRPHAVGLLDVAQWQHAHRSVQRDAAVARLDALLANTNRANLQVPSLVDERLDPLSVPATATLTSGQFAGLEVRAQQLGTTLPLLLHGLFSVLVARLTGDEAALAGETDLLLCHVTANREHHPDLQAVVGCLDTSVPVAVRLQPEETLATLCRKTRLAFVEAYACVTDLPRAGWIPAGVEGGEAALFERVAHINVLREPEPTQRASALGMRQHRVRRTQRTRWGALLRVTLPAATPPSDPASTELGLTVHAEDRALARALETGLVWWLHAILGEGPAVGQAPVHGTSARLLERLAFSSARVRQAAAQVPRSPAVEPFLYTELVARQRRWYEHERDATLRRDACNRFIGTRANPFPFTQLDKLSERAFLERADVPMPTLLHVLPREGLRDALVAIAPSLPPDFVIKPVGAGHSVGVTVVRGGRDLTREGVPFDVDRVASELSSMAERGSCVHQGQVFPFNFSSFLIEALVDDERGFPKATDYKLFMLGERLLWIQLHFEADGHTWVAFLDETFTLNTHPAWDPRTCWRTHGALVCTDPTLVDARRPACLPSILAHARRLATTMGVFVRLDWYADARKGPLLGEVTLFPHMLQPRGFYSDWANETVRAAWQGLDGVARPQAPASSEGVVARVETLLDGQTCLVDAFPEDVGATWSVGAGVTYGALRAYVDGFDLAPWGVESGDRVAVCVHNGSALAGLLLALMNRYVAVPLSTGAPVAFVADQLRDSAAHTLIVQQDSEEDRRAQELARHLPTLRILRVRPDPSSPLLGLPPLPVGRPILEPSPSRGPEDPVVLLWTSGTTGVPKAVRHTLAWVVRAGAGIAASLQLTPQDVGVAMLPLHRIGGLTCNVLAPLLAGSQVRFQTGFDPAAFFAALQGPRAGSWSYLVPSMWKMVLGYSRSHAHLLATRPWPRLRLVRSAGAELPHALARELAELFGDAVAILPTYGMTEVMPIASPPCAYRLERAGSVGRAVPGISIEVVDSSNDELPTVEDGTVGEITVRAATAFVGYLGDDRPSQHLTPRGHFRTGDLGFKAADGSGWLFIEGRRKDTILRGGETLAPAEIEAALRAYPPLSDADRPVDLMAFARPHVDLGESVALAIAPLETSIDLRLLHQWAQERLPGAMWPDTLLKMAVLPRGEGGKVHRTGFAARIAEALPPARRGLLQTFVVEEGRAVPRLMEEVTRHPVDSVRAGLRLGAVVDAIQAFVGPSADIGPDTLLPEAGVSSLAAVDLAESLNEAFGGGLSTWAVSDHPTARGLFAQLSAGGSVGGRTTPSPSLQGLPGPGFGTVGLPDSAQMRVRGQAFGDASLVSLNRATSDERIFVLPPLNGYFTHYLQLGRALAPHRHLLGVRLAVLLSSTRRVPSVVELAVRAARAILQVDPGPIHLLGVSTGGMLAFETARQLRRQGVEVQELSLIDSDATLTRTRQPAELLYVRKTWEELSYRLRGTWSPDRHRHRHFVEFKLRDALVSWKPEPIDVRRATLFSARDGSLDEHHIEIWRAATRGTLQVVPIEGGHLGLERPDVAETLASWLAR